MLNLILNKSSLYPNIMNLKYFKAKQNRHTCIISKFFYVPCSFGALSIMTLHKFQFLVARSNVCSLNKHPSIHPIFYLHNLVIYSFSLCSFYLQYVLCVFNFPNLSPFYVYHICQLSLFYCKCKYLFIPYFS